MNAIENMVSSLVNVDASASSAPAVTKPADNTASKPAVKTKAYKAPFAYCLAGGSYGRVGSGAKLFAYTHAWLKLAGMFKGAEMPVETVRKIAGARAISYHTKDTGHWMIIGDMLMLTPTGQDHFNGGNPARPVDEKFLAMYVDIMQNGADKADGKIVKPEYVTKL